MHAQITALEDKIKKLIDDNKDINELQNQNKTLKETIRKQDKEIYRNQIKAITDQRQPQSAPEPVKTVRKKVLGIF